jgi:hypothetical protein
MQRIDSGGDPRGELEEEREAPTVVDLIARLEREQLPKRRPSTIRSYPGMLEKHIRLISAIIAKSSTLPLTIPTNCITR